MDQSQALQVLIEGVNVAQKRGAYSLEEAGALLHAVSAFTRPIQTAKRKRAPDVNTQPPQKPVQKAPPNEEKKEAKSEPAPEDAKQAEVTPDAEPEKKGWFGRSRGSFFANGPIGVK